MIAASCFCGEGWNLEAGECTAGHPMTPAEREVHRLRALINAPETLSFTESVQLEVAHQRERWGADSDAGKTPADWFWLVGYLAGKALHAHARGDVNKALHHTISTSAALANWHASILGKTNMRPGIEPPTDRSTSGKQP
jgi:hypothetical protein